jgi:NADH dehydrogenase (ubiquinone) Fe-S protein 1
VQTTRSALSPPGFAREDWMIIRALSEELGCSLPYDSLDEVRTRLSELAPHLVKYDHIEPSGFESLSIKPNDKKKSINMTPFTDNVDNFYMTDAISRNSYIMAKCTKELNPMK